MAGVLQTGVGEAVVIARRAFFGMAAAAPAAAKMAAQDLQLRMAGVEASSGLEVGSAPTVAQHTTLRSFAEWLARGGQREIEQRTRHITALDPDILSFNLPLSTKIMWQRDRNKERLMAERKSWFEAELEKHGVVKWWS